MSETKDTPPGQAFFQTELLTMVQCTIDWSPVRPADWDGYFHAVRRSTLLQHFPYAQANRAVNYSGARHGTIWIDGVHAGLLQLSEVGVMRNLVHALSLDRGPLWLGDFGTADQVAAFFSAFAKTFPKRLGRKLRLLPELKDKNRNRTAVGNAGFCRRDDVPGYQTIWLDLDRSLEELRANLNGKWRNILAKSERSPLVIAEDWTAASARQFLAQYAADRQQKGYDGPSVQLLIQLLKFMVPRNEAVILNAELDGEVVAAILVLLHGTSATYQVGWTTQAGRTLGAHHQLLWRAILCLKRKGILDFDLGGTNDQGAAGVKRFKQGLGGQEVSLVGFFN